MTYEYIVSGGNATITKATTGDAKIINIPSSLDGNAVTTLRGGAFKDNTIVQKVGIPETVTNLTYYSSSGVFQGCLALTACNIPRGVKAIPERCFNGCTKLRRVVLPQGVIVIGNYAFRDCSSLENLVFPVGLQLISSYAFYGCSSLTAVDLPDTVTSIGGACFDRCSNLEVVRLPSELTIIPAGCFESCSRLRTISIPNNVTAINGSAFSGCSSLREVTVPAGVMSVGRSAFSSVGCVVFLGPPPAGLHDASVTTAVYPKEYGELWAAQLPIAQTGGFVKPIRPVVTIVSATVRANDPTVLDVIYKVASAKLTVKVRALAFEDGVRSFAKVTRPETFIDGTAGNIGDTVAANVEHTLSWKVSADFKTDLAKMKFEVFAIGDDILPLELTTIPANGTNRAMELSWNLLTEAQVFDALLWLYADGDSGLTLIDGVLKNGEKTLASGVEVTKEYFGTANPYYWCAALPYIFNKMGFSLLTGDALTYANEMTRLWLVPGGSGRTSPIRQYAYRWIEAQ